MMDYFHKGNHLFLLLSLLFVPFLALCYKYLGFTIDDSFIAWRYSKNLVNHGVLAWNPGQDPVEGFTSFFWVILNAGALSVGISPVVFSKGLSILSVLAIVVILLRKGTDQPWYLQFGLSAAVALSPAVAVLTTQGLETMFAALLMLATGAISVRIVKAPSRRGFLLWYGCAFVAGLVRPDTLAFSAGIFATLAAIYRSSKRIRLQSFLTLSLPFIVTGVGYMAWRTWYFGYLFPNPTYLKGDSLGGGILYTAGFFSGVLAPYLIVGTVAAMRVTEERLTEILPTLTGSLLFGGYLLNVEPIQGFLWRYAIPVLPALLYCILNLPWPIKPSHWKSQLSTVAFVIVLLIWPLHTYPTANGEVMSRTVHDRVAVGKALQGLDGRLFTSESGALAYYSEWRVIDIPGLNSEQIAHGVPPQNVLRDFEPDLIGLLVPGRTVEPSNWRFEPTLPYIRTNDYFAVAATQKTPRSHHLYFVDPSSSICKEVVSRLRTIDSVEYTTVNALIPDSLDVSTVSRSNASKVQETTCMDASSAREATP
jgi:hypothetical protein